MSTMTQPKPVVLEVTTFMGSSVYWAQHYYVKVFDARGSVEVQRVLSEGDAARLNRADRNPPGSALGREAGDWTIRFDSEDDALAAAKAVCAQVYPGSNVLTKSGRHWMPMEDESLAEPTDIMGWTLDQIPWRSVFARRVGSVWEHVPTDEYGLPQEETQ